jgi:hypothetical protein
MPVLPDVACGDEGMMSISHWGMFDAKNVPVEYWPLHWANDVDTQFDA